MEIVNAWPPADRQEAKRLLTETSWQPDRRGCRHCDHVCGADEPRMVAVLPEGVEPPHEGRCRLDYALEMIDRAQYVYWMPGNWPFELVIHEAPLRIPYYFMVPATDEARMEFEERERHNRAVMQSKYGDIMSEDDD